MGNKKNNHGGFGPLNKVVAQLHDSLDPASNLQKIFVLTSEPWQSISISNFSII